MTTVDYKNARVLLRLLYDRPLNARPIVRCCDGASWLSGFNIGL